MEIKKELFGQTNDGKDVFLYTLQNQNGVEVKVSEFGGIITSVIVPDKDGNKADVVLGYDTVEPYFTNNEFFGATIGRSSNRIANASFDIDGKIITVPANEGVNNLHSDSENGFHKKLWVAAPDEGRNCVTLSYTSPDGENGFPGNLDMKVTFGLSEDNELSIHYEGISDKKTVINCTNHTYFNLAGHDSGNIEGQYLKILASKYNTVKADSIPTGECADVEGTPFDFREFHTIGERIGEDAEQLHLTGGYDHNYAVEPENGLIAVAEDRNSGRRMEVYSALPGVQFYAGNFIRDGLKGKDGAVYGKRSGFCLETQFFPNCVNEPDFEGAFFSAGNKYDYTTVYKFTTI